MPGTSTTTPPTAAAATTTSAPPTLPSPPQLQPAAGTAVTTATGGTTGASSSTGNGSTNNAHLAVWTKKFAAANEQTWLQIGALSESILDQERAMQSYEHALRHNPYSTKALTSIASSCRVREDYTKATEYFTRILNMDNNNGEIWGALGHCYLMMDELQKAYTAYQQALYHLPNPKDPKLWYGIGILYDRYGSLEHAEESFTTVLKMDPKFEKANEIYFRLGIIYKQQHKYTSSLECFLFIQANPPPPLTEADLWFQIGHVYEQQKEYKLAKEAYEKVLTENPSHSKTLQQLGWLMHQPSPFMDQNVAIKYLSTSLEIDKEDIQTWYLLGRIYMAQQKYSKAYECYQQAVYRDGRNPNFWCSIGVLYFQIHQYRDALDAYSRALRINPCISEVWFNLGTLYEACSQVTDAVDAYQRASELDPSNTQITQRLALLREAQRNGRLAAPAAGLPINNTTQPLLDNLGPSQIASIAGLWSTTQSGQLSLQQPHITPPVPMQVQQQQHQSSLLGIDAHKAIGANEPNTLPEINLERRMSSDVVASTVKREGVFASVDGEKEHRSGKADEGHGTPSSVTNPKQAVGGEASSTHGTIS